MKERKRRSVLQSARADGDGMRRPHGHLITRAGIVNFKLKMDNQLRPPGKSYFEIQYFGVFFVFPVFI